MTQGVPIKRWWVRNNTKELEEVAKMTVEITLAVLVSIASLSFSVYMGLKNNKRTDEKEIAERIARDTRTDMKLDEISKDIKEVKETVKNIQNDVKDHEGRIVKLEASYKALHKRLDEIFNMIELKERE